MIGKLFVEQEPQLQRYEIGTSRGMDRLSLEDEANKILDDDDGFVEFAKQESRDSLSLYDTEGQVLTLYDQLVELKLEKAIFEAQLELSSGDNFQINGIDEAQIKAAERECLEARATYLLRCGIVENVLITDPVLKSVHSGGNATPAERLLHPLIDRRDVLGIAHTNLATSLDSKLKDLTKTEVQNIQAKEKNQESASQLMNLTDQIRLQQSTAMNEAKLNRRLEILQADTRIAKKRWRIMKSVVAAVIVGSGINWACHDEWKDFVIDEEE